MARDEATGSLADQAAAWVPPWARRPGEPDPDDLDGPVGEGLAVDEPGPGGLGVPVGDAVGSAGEGLAADEPGSGGLGVPVGDAVGLAGEGPAAGAPDPDHLAAGPIRENTAADGSLDERDVTGSTGGPVSPVGKVTAVDQVEPVEATASEVAAAPAGQVPAEVADVPAEVSAVPAGVVPAEVVDMPVMSPHAAGPAEAAPSSVVDDEIDTADTADITPVAQPTTDRDAAPRPQADVEAATPDEAQLAVVSDEELRGAVEAILLVVDEPVSEIMLAQVVEQPTERVAGVLTALAAEYNSTERGFELRRIAGGWRLYTRARFAGYVEKFVLDGQQVRLTQAALETLAVVAYKQPVTRSRISAIRGVNCDGVVRTLLSRGLIEECGSEPDSGAHLYRTTTLFLEKLGLDSLDQLPALAPFLPDDLEALEDGHG